MNKPYRGPKQPSERVEKSGRGHSGRGARAAYGRSQADDRQEDFKPRRTQRSEPSQANFATKSTFAKGNNDTNESDLMDGFNGPDAVNGADGTNSNEPEQAVLPGIKPVLELLSSDPARIDTVLIRRGRRTADTDTLMDMCRENHVRFNLVDGPALDKLYAGAHQGVVARLYAAGYIEVDAMLAEAMDAPLPIIIALDQVQDPGNAGTLARTLYALGGAGLIVPRHNAAYLGASAQRAAAGALEKLPVARVTNLARALDDAIDAGFTVYGAMLGKDSVNAFATKLHTPCVLVLGNEDKGIRPNVAKRCHKLLHIPMLRSFDSLNVAQAGALLLGEFARNLLIEK